MTATNHTEHYGLSQYTEDDRPTYTGDYNSDMTKIDAAIYAASQSGGTSGLTEVAHTADLTGDGSDSSPLGVADTIARTEDIPSLDGYATTESVTRAIAAAIADRLTAGDIKAGSGINIETSGNQVTISYVGGGSSGGLTAVAHDNTLTGDGTANTPLGMNTGYLPSKPEYLDKMQIPNVPYTVTAFSSDELPAMDYGPLLTLTGFSSENILLFFPRSAANGTRLWLGSTQNGEINQSEWREVAYTSQLPDVSALTSRIAALESQVAALTSPATPSTTGLAATQLDTQYSDNYNIVRVGTPTRSNESEESSQ